MIKFNIKFREENREYNPDRSQYAAKKFLPKGKFKVLDCGSGLGEFAIIMKERGYEIVCVDGNDTFVKATKEKGFESYECDFEKENLPFRDNAFDGVVCLEIIEHIWNTREFLQEIKRVLKPEGWLIISTPNYSFWKFRIKHLLGELYPPPSSRHKRFYSFKSFLKVLTDNNFKIEDWFVVSSIPKIRRVTTKLLPNLIGLHTILKCTPLF